MLILSQVRAGYNSGEVLKGISLEVHPGEIVALLGANGAGKTTTLHAISGLVPLRAGSISWKGQSLAALRPDEILRRGIGHGPEGRRIFPRLSVRENLLLGSYSRKARDDAGKLEYIYNYFPILQERSEQWGGTLSGGEQQMLAIARALMSEPEILLLDEPSLGLAPLMVEKIFQIIQQINRAGTPILLVEQNARQALQIAQRGYVLVNGEIPLTDSGANLLQSDDVRRAYFGES